MGLAATGGPDQKIIGLGQHVFALGSVEVDALDAPHMAVRHQRDRAPRLFLAPVAQLLEPLEDFLGRNDRQLTDKLDEVLKAGFAVLLEVLHPGPPVDRFRESTFGEYTISTAKI